MSRRGTAELTSNGLVYRYRDTDDGLPPPAAPTGPTTLHARRGSGREARRVSSIEALPRPCSAVARRLGMRLDGTLREAFVHNDRHQDVQVWSVLATEWPAKR